MSTVISQSRIEHIKADIENYGKPMVCRKLGISIDTVVDLQLEDDKRFSNNLIELFSLKANALQHILGTRVTIDASKINSFHYLMEQSGLLDDLQFSIKGKRDFIIKVAVRRREYNSDGTYTDGHLGYEYFWFAGSSYDEALIIALAFVSDYQARDSKTQATLCRGKKAIKTPAEITTQPFLKRVVATIQNKLLAHNNG